MTAHNEDRHVVVRDRSVELRAWSVQLIARSRDACKVAASTQQRARRMSPAVAPVAVTELFTILVDHHGLGVYEAVRNLALQLAIAGYPEEAESVSASDAVGITHAILAGW